MKKFAPGIVFLFLAGASADAPAPLQTSAAAKTLAFSALKLARMASPGVRSLSLAEGASALADLAVKELEAERPVDSAYYGRRLLRLTDGVAAQALAFTEDSAETDAELASSLKSASESLEKLKALLPRLGESDRAGLIVDVGKIGGKLKSASEAVEKRRAKRGGADEKPEEKKPGEKKPDEGQPGKPGDY